MPRTQITVCHTLRSHDALYSDHKKHTQLTPASRFLLSFVLRSYTYCHCTFPFFRSVFSHVLSLHFFFLFFFTHTLNRQILFFFSTHTLVVTAYCPPFLLLYAPTPAVTEHSLYLALYSHTRCHCTLPFLPSVSSHSLSLHLLPCFFAPSCRSCSRSQVGLGKRAGTASCHTPTLPASSATAKQLPASTS